MIKVLKYAIINYNECDNNYIDEICDYFEIESKNITKYLEIIDIKEKANIIIYNDINEFKINILKDNKYYKTIKDIPNYVVAVGGDDKNISILSLDNYIKVENHQNCTIEDYKKTLVHEFVHFCHHKLNAINMIWINEGLATNLSRQATKYKNNNINLPLKSYSDYCLAFEYVMKKYNKKYILRLLNDIEFQKIETPKILEEILNNNL